MELKLYLRILLEKWWLVLTAIILTVVPTYLYVNQQPWIYESRATFVIRPRASFDGDNEGFVKAVDTLSNRVAINTTFAQVASSRAIKTQAMDSLGLSEDARRGLSVDSRVIAGTNVLEISVQGPDPAVVRDVTEAVSVETVNYVGGLYDVFQLEPLDAAEYSGKPVSPNKTLNIAVGTFLGVLSGVSLVFLLEYLKTPETTDVSLNIIDADTGIYNKTYLMLRLRQELHRARRNNRVVSLALLEVNNRGLATAGAARQVPVAKASAQIAVALGAGLREEDILAHLGDSIFALLLPDMTSEATRVLLEDVRAKIGLLPSGSEMEKGLTIYSTIGFATYEQGDVDEETFLMQAAEALTEASGAIYGKVSMYTPPVQEDAKVDGQAGAQAGTKVAAQAGAQAVPAVAQAGTEVVAQEPAEAVPADIDAGAEVDAQTDAEEDAEAVLAAVEEDAEAEVDAQTDAEEDAEAVLADAEEVDERLHIVNGNGSELSDSEHAPIMVIENSEVAS